MFHCNSVQLRERFFLFFSGHPCIASETNELSEESIGNWSMTEMAPTRNLQDMISPRALLDTNCQTERTELVERISVTWIEEQ